MARYVGLVLAALFASEEERGAVVVELATTRADHAGYFRARYGPLVRTRVVGDRHECAAFDF